MFDFDDGFDILASIGTLPRGSSPGPDLFELRLPEPQYVTRQSGYSADLAYFEIKLIGNFSMKRLFISHGQTNQPMIEYFLLNIEY